MDKANSIETTVMDIINSHEFKLRIQHKLNKIDDDRQKAFKNTKGFTRFKRGPVDWLVENNAWTGRNIAAMLPAIIDKRSPLPATVRKFVDDLAYPILVEIIQEQRKQQQQAKSQPKILQP